jgi:hypothetical protein
MKKTGWVFLLLWVGLSGCHATVSHGVRGSATYTTGSIYYDVPVYPDPFLPYPGYFYDPRLRFYGNARYLYPVYPTYGVIVDETVVVRPGRRRLHKALSLEGVPILRRSLHGGGSR